MQKKNGISCLCLTYGRTHLIVEALYSFLMQRYDGESELLIINDAPFQKLHFEHPKVRIINLDKTFPLWGAKEDFGIKECKYNIVVQFDDDDIAIRNCHLSNINDLYNQHKFALVHWNRGVFMLGDKIEKIMTVGNSGIVFTKDAWRTVGGYPKRNAGADMDFVRNIEKAKLTVVRAKPEDSKLSWAYRWGQKDFNLSGQGDDRNRAMPDQIIERHKRYIKSEINKGNIPVGDIRLEPSWRFGYTEMLDNFISKQNGI